MGHEISDYTPAMKCSWVYFIQFGRCGGEPGQTLSLNDIRWEGTDSIKVLVSKLENVRLFLVGVSETLICSKMGRKCNF